MHTCPRGSKVRTEKTEHKELTNLCYSPNIIRLTASRRIRWHGHAAEIEKGVMHTNVGSQAYSRKTLGRSRRKRYNIKMDEEIGPQVVELTDLD